MNQDDENDGMRERRKKILAIIGSPNSATSNTAALAGDFIETMKELDPGIDSEIVSLGKIDLKPCKGCWACTACGDCAMKDDLDELKKKILACDLLILGSPVYVESVTAQTKAFIDRIYVWLHILRLIGKPAITAVTTAGSGTAKVEGYLGMVLDLLGTIRIGRLRGIGYRPGEMPLRADYKERNRALARKAVLVLTGKKRARPRLMNFLSFWAMKAKAHFGAEWLPFEHGYWKAKGWFKLSYRKAARAEKDSTVRNIA